MLLFSLLVFSSALAFGAVWGAGENRCWKEHGEAVILRNFKLYHLLMALLFGWVNALTVCAVFNVGFSLLNLWAFLVWLWLMLWDTLILDVVWWLIRLYDYRVDYEKAVRSYNWEPNAWHLQSDWDNWLHPPLVLGVYWWWHVFADSLAGLAVLIVGVPL